MRAWARCRAGRKRPRILSIGIDPDLLKIRHAHLTACGYDCFTAVPDDVADALLTGSFNLVIFCVMLGDLHTQRIQKLLPEGYKVLRLMDLIEPDALLQMVAVALGKP